MLNWFIIVNGMIYTAGNAVVSLGGHEPPTRYVKLRVAHAPGLPGTIAPLPRATDPDVHHARAVMLAGIAN